MNSIKLIRGNGVGHPIDFEDVKDLSKGYTSPHAVVLDVIEMGNKKHSVWYYCRNCGSEDGFYKSAKLHQCYVCKQVIHLCDISKTGLGKVIGDFVILQDTKKPLVICNSGTVQVLSNRNRGHCDCDKCVKKSIQGLKYKVRHRLTYKMFRDFRRDGFNGSIDQIDALLDIDTKTFTIKKIQNLPSFGIENIEVVRRHRDWSRDIEPLLSECSFVRRDKSNFIFKCCKCGKEFSKQGVAMKTHVDSSKQVYHISCGARTFIKDIKKIDAENKKRRKSHEILPFVLKSGASHAEVFGIDVKFTIDENTYVVPASKIRQWFDSRKPKQSIKPLEERFKLNQIKIDNKYGKGKLKLLSFTGVDNPIEVECLLCGKIVERPDMYTLLFNTHSCSCSATNTVDMDAPCKLYYVKVTGFSGKVYYKIGITSRTVRERFKNRHNRCPHKIEELKVWEFSTARECFEKERAVLDYFKEFRNSSDDVLKGNGGTECFTNDILCLDRDISKY